MKEVDVNNWVRSKLFHFFKDYEDPFFGLTANVDVSAFHTLCKQNNYSFGLSVLYAATKAINQIPELRLRIKNGKVYDFDVISPGTTILHPDSTFSFCFFEMKNSLFSFLEAAKPVLKQHFDKDGIDGRAEDLNVIHGSAIPWVSFTQIKHARRFGSEDSIPKITFGKYYTFDEKLLMPVSIEINHALADGYHAGLFFEKFQFFLNSTEL